MRDSCPLISDLRIGDHILAKILLVQFVIEFAEILSI